MYRNIANYIYIKTKKSTQTRWEWYQQQQNETNGSEKMNLGISSMYNLVVMAPLDISRSDV